MDKIRLNNIQIYAYHGVFPEEKKLGQKFQVDIEISVDLENPCKTDSIDDTINYQEIFQIIELCINKKSFNLIESIAQSIAEKILLINAVINVKVVIRKPSVPIQGICDSIEVEIFRKKNGQ